MGEVAADQASLIGSFALIDDLLAANVQDGLHAAIIHRVKFRPDRRSGRW